MRAATLAAALAFAAAAALAPGSAARDSTVTPARLQVTATEFRLALSRTSLRAGAAIIQLYNLGEDDHDLALRRIGSGAVTRRIATTGPGMTRDVEVRLRPGSYRLWCTLLDHRARGMRATLAVKPA